MHSGGSDEGEEDDEDEAGGAILDPESAADVDRLRAEWLAAKRKGLGITGRAQWHEGTKWDIGDPWQFAPPSDEQLIESARIMNLPKALAKCAPPSRSLLSPCALLGLPASLSLIFCGS